MKLLTVVVPSYNTEKYIDECLPTMISDGSIHEIEILLISDGSTDNTLNKLRLFESEYPDSIRVIDKENGGHGSVINRGIEEAQGKYFKVIDGDDWVITENFNKLINAIRTIDADLIMNPYIRHNILTNTEILVGRSELQPNIPFVFDSISKKIPLLALHSITYRTELLRNHNLHFQEKCFYEDAEYYIYPVLHVNLLVYLDFPVYVYRIGSPTQSVNPNNAIRNKNMLKVIVENLIRFYNSIPAETSKEKRKYITNQICHVIQNMYGIYLKMPIGKEAFSCMNNFDKQLKKQSPDLYSASGTMVIKTLRFNCYPIYVIACKMFEKKRENRGF